MIRIRRTTAIALAACAATTVLSVVPASAITPDPWTPGRVPFGCNGTVSSSATSLTAWTYTFTDASVPEVTDAYVGVAPGKYTVLPPAGKVVPWTVKVTDTCSGTDRLLTKPTWNGTTLGARSMTQASTDAFHATFSDPALMRPSDAGAYWFQSAIAQRRYDQLVLDQDFRYVTSTPSSSSPLQVGPWAGQKSWVLVQTTLVPAQSATKVKKGKPVTFTAILKYATNTGFVADLGEKVVVQARVGTGAWKTRATLTAGATGAVAFTFKPTATTQVRFSHLAVLSGRFTAGVVSAVKVVKLV